MPRECLTLLAGRCAACRPVPSRPMPLVVSDRHQPVKQGVAQLGRVGHLSAKCIPRPSSVFPARNGVSSGCVYQQEQRYGVMYEQAIHSICVASSNAAWDSGRAGGGRRRGRRCGWSRWRSRRCGGRGVERRNERFQFLQQHRLFNNRPGEPERTVLNQSRRTYGSGQSGRDWSIFNQSRRTQPAPADQSSHRPTVRSQQSCRS